MKAKLIAIAMGVLTLGGCSAQYRQALADYRRHEPTPYLQGTLAWVNAPGGAPIGAMPAMMDHATTPTTAAPAPPLEGAGGAVRVEEVPTSATAELAALRGEFGSPEEAFTKVVAQVFALTPEAAGAQLAPLRDEAAAKARLAKRLDWATLRLAVALYNPAVRAGGESWQAALRQFEQADYLEALVTEYRTFTRSLNVEPGNQMNRQMAQTFFPSPSAIALKGDMVRQMARMAHAEWAMTLRDQVVEAGQAFYEYQYQTRAIAVARENIALVKDLLGVVETSYSAGAGSQSDLVKLQTTLARQENELRDMEAMRAAQRAKINAALGWAAGTPLGAPEDKDYPRLSPRWTAFMERALAQRQEVQIAQARAERTRAAIRMGEVMNRPLASQGYSVLERGMMGEAAPDPGAMGAPQEAMGAAPAEDAPGGASPSFGLRAKAIDRPLYAQAESYLAEMRQRLAAEEAQLEQARAQTRGLAREMIEELGTAQREVALVRGEVLPKNEFTFNTARAAYTAGQTTFLDMLDAERMLLDSRMELQRARRDQNKAALRLAMVAGQLVLP